MMGAVQRWFVAGLAGAAVLSTAGAAGAFDVTDADRVSVNYTRETATVGEHQLRIEIRGLKTEDDSTNPDLNAVGLRLKTLYPANTAAKVDAGHVDLIGSYGFGKNAEVGFIVPGVIQSLRFKDAPVRNDADIGDFLMYVKFKREVAQHCAVGAGVELTTPNGSTTKGLGTGELGVNPVVSTRYQRGALAVGANAGYQIYTGSVPDAVNYGGEVIVRGNETFAFRTEVAGRVFEEHRGFADLTLLPGVDVSLANNLTVRPTGLVGLTSSAPQWGIGIGVAVTF